MKPGIIPCPDDRLAASEAARVVIEARARAGDAGFALALSGGRSAPHLFAALVAENHRRRAGLEVSDFFWADERCVAPEHAESNYRVARAGLFDPLGVGGERVHRLEGERTPVEAARFANEDWDRFLARRGTVAPWLDCVVLGLGEDGHVGSLFPENLEADIAATTAFRAVTGSKPPPWRVTMGYPLLWEARLVVVLVTGNGKESVLKRSLAGDASIPLGRVFAGRGGLGTIVVAATPDGVAPACRGGVVTSL